MSDYITREQVIDVLKETGIIQDNDLGHLVVDEINRIPTVDEKEIVRNTVERIMERLEELRTCSDFGTCNYCQYRWCPRELLDADEAIEIVKEVGGLNE